MANNKGIWLSYDLGLKGDYTGLYTWLDGLGAKECGDSVAFFLVKEYKGVAIKETLKQEIPKHVKLNPTDRIYIVYKDYDSGQAIGSYIFGGRKRSPWDGYATGKANEDDSGS